MEVWFELESGCVRQLMPAQAHGIRTGLYPGVRPIVVEKIFESLYCFGQRTYFISNGRRFCRLPRIGNPFGATSRRKM
jgi:hypothetical protein